MVLFVLFFFLKFFEAVEDVLVSFDQAAHVATETVFVEFFEGVGVPEAAAVRADFVSQHDFAVGGAAEFDFEVHQQQTGWR